MTPTVTRRLADANLAVALVVIVVAPVPYVLDHDLAQFARDWNLTITAAALVAVLPTLVARRRPGNRLVGVLVVASANATAQLVGTVLLQLSLPSPRPPATALVFDDLSAGAWLGEWIGLAWFVVAPGLLVTSVLLRFPDGDLPSPRWRPVEWMAVGGMLTTVVGATLVTHPASSWTVERANLAPPPLVVAGLAAVGVAAVLSLVAVTTRLRRSRGAARQQMRWAGLGVAVFAITAPVSLAVDFGGTVDAAGQPTLLFQYTSFPALLVMEACLGVAILRYRLYDIDVVINRTVVFGTLAAAITSIYVAIVVGLGTLLGDTSDLALSIGATAVVALVFEPVRARVQHAANVLVYGERATPYEVLATMTTGPSATPSELVVRAAQLLAEGTGALGVVVWQADTGELVPRWSWPEQAPTPQRVEVGDGDPVPLTADLVRPLERNGTLVGAVTVSKPRDEPPRPTDVRLVEEFAGQAAVLVANAGLTDQLLARRDELAASRRRMLAAQDDARRRLERDIHDGAQQSIVALKVKLGLARSIAGREEVPAVADLVAELGQEVDAAVASLRELARGVYPPLLEAEGLDAALRARARRLPITTTVRADGAGRHDRVVEATVYFCVVAVLQALGHEADILDVDVIATEGAVVFTVSATGGPESIDQLDLQEVHDRLDIAEGALEVSNTVAGLTVRGRVPRQGARRDQAATSSSGVNSDLETNPTAPAATAPVV